MFVGVFIVGRLHGKYSHLHQFCSELGARGGRTEKISPLINNYPLGFLFILFGLYIISASGFSVALMFCGALIIVHGVATWMAGYYPMDLDPYTKSPSHECKLHTLAGGVMFISLFLAQLVMIVSGKVAYMPLAFKGFSVACLVLSVAFNYLLVNAYKAHSGAGLYQRLAYGAQLFWLCGLSVVLFAAR
ncbi:MAG: DUF998 domain-containing protein [Agarilytica sp.]